MYLWNTRRETQIQTKLDQPPWKNGQHQTGPQLQASRKKRSWTPQETMAMRRCRNRSNDLIHGGRRWWWYTNFILSYIYIFNTIMHVLLQLSSWWWTFKARNMYKILCEIKLYQICIWLVCIVWLFVSACLKSF